MKYSRSIQGAEHLAKEIEKYVKKRKSEGLPLQVAGVSRHLGVDRTWMGKMKNEDSRVGEVVRDFYLQLEESLLDHAYKIPQSGQFVKFISTNTFHDYYKEKQEIETNINVNYKNLSEEDLQKMIDEKMAEIQHNKLISSSLEVECKEYEEED